MPQMPSAQPGAFKKIERSRTPRFSVQNFESSAPRKNAGTHAASASNIGGTVKSSAAASHSSGRRGMNVSLLAGFIFETARACAGNGENALRQAMVQFAPTADAGCIGVARARLQ